MIDRHKVNPVTFRPPEPDRVWLYAYAEETGQSVGSILSEALKRLRECACLDHLSLDQTPATGPDGLCDACRAEGCEDLAGEVGP